MQRVLTSRSKQFLPCGYICIPPRSSNDWSISLLYKLPYSWQLIPCHSQCFSNNLLVNLTTDFQNDSSMCNTCSPIIKTSLSFTHSRLVTGCIHSNICSYSRE